LWGRIQEVTKQKIMQRKAALDAIVVARIHAVAAQPST
jgi:hypothetical protein